MLLLLLAFPWVAASAAEDGVVASAAEDGVAADDGGAVSGHKAGR